jgi:hypothetical protein
VIAFALMLQSVYSLQVFAYVGYAWSGSWSTLKATLPWQLLLCDAVWFVSTLGCLAASLALCYRRAWGRALYIWTTVASIAVTISLPFRLNALISLPFAGLFIALVYSKRSYDFFAESHHMPPAHTVRDLVRIGALGLSCLLHFFAMSFAASRAGWLPLLMPQGRPLSLLIAATIALFFGVALSPKGQRAWNCGMTLMIFSVSMTCQLLAHVTTSTPLIKYLPPPFRFTPFPWSVMIAYTAVVGLTATALLQWTRPPRHRPPLEMPDFS